MTDLEKILLWTIFLTCVVTVLLVTLLMGVKGFIVSMMVSLFAMAGCCGAIGIARMLAWLFP